jgi:hypothetical protein
MNMFDYIKDKWLTWRTGLKKQDREFSKWVEETVVQNAPTIENMFMNFKFILPVSTQIFDHNEPFGWVPNEEFRQYMYPNRAIGDCAVYYFARGYRDRWDGRFYKDDISCDQDQVFVATNNERDAIMIALRWV